MTTEYIYTVIAVTNGRRQVRFYVIEQARTTLRWRRSCGPYVYHYEAVKRKKELVAAQRKWLKSAAAKCDRSQSRLHRRRTERLRHITAYHKEYLHDWQQGKYEGPCIYRADIITTTKLTLRDNDLTSPHSIPVGVWLGPTIIPYYKYRPMIIYHDDQYRLFAYVGQFPDSSLKTIREIRIPLQYTLPINESQLENIQQAFNDVQ